MEFRKIMYIAIIIFCIFAIGVGVYSVVFKEDVQNVITYTNILDNNNDNEEEEPEELVRSQEEIKTRV